MDFKGNLKKRLSNDETGNRFICCLLIEIFSKVRTFKMGHYHRIKGLRIL